MQGVSKDLQQYSFLLLENKGIRKRTLYHAGDIRSADGQEAVRALPAKELALLEAVVQAWVAGVQDQIKDKKAMYVARHCTWFLRDVAARFAATLDSFFGISVNFMVRTGSPRFILSSKYQIDDRVARQLLQLQHSWIISPVARSPLTVYTREGLTYLCDDTAGLLRIIAGAVLHYIAKNGGLDLKISIAYNYKKVTVDPNRASLTKGRLAKFFAPSPRVGSSYRPSRLPLSVAPKITSRWMD